jgi:hypothetical protein
MDQRGPSPELVGIKRPMRVAADDAVDHDQHARLFGVLREPTRGVSPVGELDSAVESEAELVT